MSEVARAGVKRVASWCEFFERSAIRDWHGSTVGALKGEGENSGSSTSMNGVNLPRPLPLPFDGV